VPDNRGTSNRYALRRLREERPDLHQRVVAGEISAHAAAVEAGIRPPRFTITGRDPAAIANTIRHHLPDEVIKDLVQLLTEPKETT
jgi:hypothetical protein